MTATGGDGGARRSGASSVVHAARAVPHAGAAHPLTRGPAPVAKESQRREGSFAAVARQVLKRRSTDCANQAVESLRLIFGLVSSRSGSTAYSGLTANRSA